MNTLCFDIRIETERRLLVDIRDFQIAPQEVTFLFGESGIGKSLIARAIYGLLDPEEFCITINREPYDVYLKKPETDEIRKNSFFVFQEPSTHLNPLLQLGTQLNEGSLARPAGDAELLKYLWDSSEWEEIKRLLEVYPKPYRPSGGEKQRIFLVMALKKIDLVMQAASGSQNALFVFDEPTGSLDNHFRNVFLSLLFRRFQRARFTTLLITHDYSMISEVTASHTNILDGVAFRELSLERERLAMRDFQPEVYLNWLKSRGTDREAQTSPKRERPLLTVESGARVFGQELTISREEPSAKQCALEVLAGSVVYVKAPSGEGKTTLMKMIMGLIRGENFRLMLGGRILTDRTPRRFWQKYLWGRKLTMVFQHADEALNPLSTVWETFQGLPARDAMTAERVKQTLSELYDFEITEAFLNKQVRELSGGQKQKLNLLRSLCLDTDMIILDEPFNGLDFKSTTNVLSMLRERQRSGKGILIVSHNEEIVSTIVDDDGVFYLRSHRVS
jgi:ABC-type glutathione transport system ATPase component